MSRETGSSDPLRLAARKVPEAPAVDAPGGIWSYAELDRAADRVAGRLRPLVAAAVNTSKAANAVGAADAASKPPRPPGPPVVSAFLPPTAPAVAVLHGVPRAGAVLAPLHADWKPPELAGLLARLEPVTLLVPPATRNTAAAALELAGLETERISLDEMTEAALDEAAGRDVRIHDTHRDREAPAGRADPPTSGPGGRIHSLLSTSGTSGRPRLVQLSGSNLLASARGVTSRLGLGPEDRWLASLAFAHVGGLAMAFRAAVTGSTLVLRGRFDAVRFSRELEAAGITHVSLVPTMLRRLLEARGERFAPPGLACALLGGAATDPALLERALERAWPVALTYGLTEAASQVATAEPERVRRKPGTVGPALPGIELRIEESEILVRGSTVMAGYWDGPAEALEDGWLRTGDLGRLDDDGDLWIAGRRSARIVTGGVTVDPAEVEAVLLTHPGVRDAVVVGLPDEEWGERVVAAVEPGESPAAPSRQSDRSGRRAADDDSTVAPGDLITALERLCRERLSGPKRPKVFHVVDRLPRTPTGKPDREAARRIVLATHT